MATRENRNRITAFQSTPSAWRETQPLSERTVANVRSFQSTPSAWRETSAVYVSSASIAFQSAPSAWRETFSAVMIGLSHTYFNPLPPHGGRHVTQSEYDLPMWGSFQSTPSAWRETVPFDSAWISRRYFNPLPPHGGRLALHSVASDTVHFNPLPPHGGRLPFCQHPVVRIHFNPLPPHGGRPRPCSWSPSYMLISIHSLRMEGDAALPFCSLRNSIISIHSLRMEGDRGNTAHQAIMRNTFQSTPSAWRETLSGYNV